MSKKSKGKSKTDPDYCLANFANSKYCPMENGKNEIAAGRPQPEIGRVAPMAPAFTGFTAQTSRTQQTNSQQNRDRGSQSYTRRTSQ